MSDGETARDRLGVFLSYSRRDLAAADRLVAALEDADFAVTIDRRDLPYGEEWQAELADFIRASDTVVWLVSPASVQSRWCNWELGEVQRINKRLIPVAIEAVAPEALPEALGRIHVLPAEGSFDFDRDLAKLVEALNTDRSWLKEQTRLADRARQWLARYRSPALLLRGVALKDAQGWADRKPHTAPAPSDDILQLLLASRHAQARRQRIAVVSSLAAAIVGIGLAGIATWQWFEADAQREQAQRNFDTARETVDGVVVSVARGLRGVEGMRAESIRTILDQARMAVDRLVATAPANGDLLRTRATLHAEFGQTYLTLGNTAFALLEFVQLRLAAELLKAVDPDDRQWQAALWAGQTRIGDVQLARGDAAEALASYQAGLAIVERVVETVPDDAAWQQNLSASLSRMGDMLARQGDFGTALSRYQASLEVVERLAATHPDNIELQRDLALGHENIGDVLGAQGDFPAALTRYEASLAVREQIAAADLLNTEFQTDLSVGYDKVAHALRDQRDLSGALMSYRKSLSIRERLAATDADNTDWQDGLSYSFEKVGEVLAAQGNLAEAIQNFDSAVAIRKSLVSADPGNILWLQNLSIAHNTIGDAWLAKGDAARALAAYKAALTILDGQVASGPDDAGLQEARSFVQNKIDGILADEKIATSQDELTAPEGPSAPP